MRRALALFLVVLSGCGGRGVDTEDPTPGPPTVTPRWAKGSGDGSNQVPWSVAVDSKGGVVVVGEFGGSFDLAGPLTATKGAVNGYVLKIGRDGSKRWAKKIGDDASAFAVAVGRDDHVHVGGWFRGTLAIDGFTLTSAGETDAYWLELDENGKVLLARSFGDAGSQAITSIGVDAGASRSEDEGVVLAGDFDGAMDFGLGSVTSHGTLDVFVARFDAARRPVFGKALGGPLLDRRPKVAVGRDGAAFVAATYRGPIDVGGGPLPDRFDSAFLTRLSKTGDHVWSKGFGGTGWCYPTTLAVEDDRVAFAGRFTDTLELGAAVLESESGEDAVLGVFGDDGALRLSRRYGGFGQDVISGVAWNQGDLWVAGEVQTTLGPLVSAGSADLFVARLGPDLSIRAAQRYGDAELQRGQRIAVDPLGGAVVVGAYFGHLDFGVANLLSSGGFDESGGDVFVASFTP